MIYDAWGNEIRPDKRPDKDILAVASLRDRWSTYPSNGLTPERLASIFREADLGNVWRQAELFEEMEEKDTHLFSVLQTRKLAITGLDFEIQPYSEDKRDVEVADFIKEVINDLLDFEGNLQDMSDAIGKGYSVMEMFWDVRGGKNVVRHIEWIHPKRITWYNTLTPKLLSEFDMINGKEIPPFKTIFHLHKMRSGHHNRQGVLRTVAWMYIFKNYDIKDWVAFAEVFGFPFRLGKYDPITTKTEDREKLYEAVVGIGRDAAAVISKSTEIEFVEAIKESGGNLYEGLASFCNAEMSKTILGQTLTTQQGDSGSYSLGKVHNEVRADLLRADCEMVAKTLRRDLIRPLVGFNFGWDIPLPWFKFHYEEPEDLQAEATKLKTLVDAGVRSIPVKWVHEKFNIPMPEAGEETLSVPQIPAIGGAQPTQKIAMKAQPVVDVKQEYQDQVILDKAVEEIQISKLQQQVDDILKPVIDTIGKGSDYKEILDNISKLQINDVSFINELTNALFISNAWGRMNA